MRWIVITERRAAGASNTEREGETEEKGRGRPWKDGVAKICRKALVGAEC